jgi:hypothetical protein
MKNPEIRNRFLALLAQAVQDATEVLSSSHHFENMFKRPEG